MGPMFIKEVAEVAIYIGCQTCSWEMRGDDWTRPVDEILDAIAEAGYQGLEITNFMLREYAQRPDEFARALDERGLMLAAFNYSRAGFTDPAAGDSDLAGAYQALDFVANFPCRLLGVGGPANPTRQDYDVKMNNAVEFYAGVVNRARQRDVRVAVHPHSHHKSLVETAAEYDRLLAATENIGLQFNPDSGHITRGDQDFIQCLRRHLPRVVHVHTKDVDEEGQWQPLGRGICDFRAMFELLAATGYDGWVIAEEESQLAWEDPVAAIVHNREYLRELGY